MKSKNEFSKKLWVRAFLLGLFFFSMAELKAQKKDVFKIGDRIINKIEFDNELLEAMEIEKIPGLSVSIIDKGRIVYTNAYGYKKADRKRKIKKNTVFEAASLSKIHLTYVVCKLIDEGKLDLDQPVHRYLENDELEYDSRYKLITPRMILSHTSGIENWKAFSNSEKLEILEEPGSKYVYSGAGYNYLAKVVEKILNEPYEDYVEKMVIKPLELKRTFTKYNFLGPKNYANGHYYFGQTLEKIKNKEAVPSSFNNTNSEDLAKLMIAFFDENNISDKTIEEVLKPAVRLQSDINYHGLGFEIQYLPHDTIVAHGGHNSGYFNFVWYSITQKRGVVWMSNSESGIALMEKINDMSAKLDLNFDDSYSGQFPSRVSDVISLYKEQGAQKVFSAVDEIITKEGKGLKTERLINDLATAFAYQGYPETSLRLLDRNLELHPDSGYAHYLHGMMNYWDRDYRKSRMHLNKVAELDFFRFPVKPFIKMGDKKLDEIRIKKPISYKSTVLSVNTRIEAEDYNAMDGIEIRPVMEKEGEEKVSYYNWGDWLDYKIDVPQSGVYEMSFRVTSNYDLFENIIRLDMNSESIASLKAPYTKGWDTWTTVKKRINLTTGSHTVRLLMESGACNIDWINFEMVQNNSK